MFDFFEKPGKKIKTAAKVLFVLMIIGFFIGGFLLPIYPYETKLQAIILTLLFFAVGVLVSYLSALMLYAVGSHIEDTREILLLLRRSDSKKRSVEKRMDPDVRPKVPEEEERRDPPAELNSDYEGTWQCDCGAVNPNRIKTCACGRSLYEVVANRLGRQDE